MESGHHFLGFALSATAFAALFLGGLIAYGGEASRPIALGAAFLAATSQFVAQDRRAWLASVILAYLSMLVGLVAFAVLIGGH